MTLPIGRTMYGLLAASVPGLLVQRLGLSGTELPDFFGNSRQGQGDIANGLRGKA